jgi:hypothetical protein
MGTSIAMRITDELTSEASLILGNANRGSKTRVTWPARIVRPPPALSPITAIRSGSTPNSGAVDQADQTSLPVAARVGWSSAGAEQAGD